MDSDGTDSEGSDSGSVLTVRQVAGVRAAAERARAARRGGRWALRSPWARASTPIPVPVTG